MKRFGRDMLQDERPILRLCSTVGGVINVVEANHEYVCGHREYSMW